MVRSVVHGVSSGSGNIAGVSMSGEQTAQADVVRVLDDIAVLLSSSIDRAVVGRIASREARRFEASEEWRRWSSDVAVEARQVREDRTRLLVLREQMAQEIVDLRGRAERAEALLHLATKHKRRIKR